MIELELVAQLAPDVPLDDVYAQAARAHARERLAALRVAPPRRPRRRLRFGVLAGVAALAVLGLLLFTQLGGGDSAIARARAALTLPRHGLLVVDSHSTVTTAAGVHVAHYGFWQDLATPSNERTLQTDPYRHTLVDRSTLRGLTMRYVPGQNAVLTQRVIVSPNALPATDGVYRMWGRLRTLLADRTLRDLGTIEQGGRTSRRLSGTLGGLVCTYSVQPVTFRPEQLDCLAPARNGSQRVHDIVTYRLVPAGAVADRQLDLRAAYPGAQVRQDPAGIPGRAGRNLSDITQPLRYPWTVTDPLLRQTSDAAIRAARRDEQRASSAETACLTSHGVPFADGGYSDPGGTVIEICQHLQDDAEAVQRSPAWTALARRQNVAVQAAWRCITRGMRVVPGPRGAARQALYKRCADRTRDPVAGGLAVP